MGTTTLSSYVGSGIVLTNSGAYQSPFTITANGTVSASGGTGVYSNVAAPSLLNQGLVTAASGIGVEFMFGGAVTNSGAASIAGWTGVELQGTGATLLNAGTVTGTSGAGALFTNAGYIYNNAAGTIAGTTDGVQMQTTGGTLVNEGLVTGTTIGAALQGAAYIGNIGTGAAINGATGVYIAANSGLSGTVYNDGTITGSGGGDYGVQIAGSGTVINAGTAALISGYRGVVFQTASGTVLNDGTIAGNGTGVQLDHGGTVTNNAGAAITGGFYAAIRIEAGGVVLNAGTINSAPAGIVFNADGVLSNLAAGVISGRYNAVEFLQGSGEVYNAGTINAGFNGQHAILLSDGGTVTNTGSISILSAYSTALELAGGTVLNQGVIMADAHRANGIILDGGGAITNSGTVIAGYFGVELGGTGDTLLNSGNITGTYGIYSNLFGDTVINSGTITGANTAVKLGSGGTLINSGTLAGGGDAAEFGGNALLVVEAGAGFTGNVVANGGGNTLELGAGTGRLDGIGAQFSGFNTVAFAAGAAWTLSGNNSGFSGGEVITGFTLGDAIILDGFSATGASHSSAGLVLTNGTTPEALNIGAVHGNYFAVSAANNQTTISVTNIIGYTVSTATLATNQSLTISNSGKIAPPAAGGTGTNGIVALYAAAGVKNASVLNDGVNAGSKGANGGIVSGFGGYYVVNAGTGGTGADLLGGVSLTNAGQISGGAGGTSSIFNNGNGGDGAYLGGGAALTNMAAGVITGGDGGSTHYDYFGGGGAGAGVSLAAGATLTNAGIISAGNVVDGKIKTNGVNGGNGVNLSAGVDVANSGTIAGGKGGASVYVAGAGGTGLNLQSSANAAAATLTNTDVITGGNGENGYYGYPKNHYTIINPGNGGVAVNLAGAATLMNTGKIIGGAAGNGVNAHNGNGGNAADLGGGAVLINLASGVIVGGDNAGTGVSLAAGGMLTNAGIISGGTSPDGYRGTAANGGIGADVSASANLDNSGTIAGGQGGPSIFNVGAGGVGLNLRSGASASNAGHIFGGQAGTSQYDYSIGGASGAVIGSGATLSNGGVIAGGQGGTNDVDLGLNRITGGGAGVVINGGVLIDRGTISGGAGGLQQGRVGHAGDAVDFTGSAGTLVVQQGAVFNGNVVANSSVADVLEVTDGVQLTGIGSQFLNFSGISFASGAAATVAGNTGGLANGEIITGFAGYDTIDLTGIVALSEHFSSGILSLYGASGLLATLDVTEGSNITSADFTISSDHAGGTDIILCFYPGTKLAYEYGTVAVEDITPGTMIKTAAGALMPVRWVGQSHVNTRFTDGLRCLPIRIKAGALGENLPRRDLLVSPDHALFIDGLLIQAGALVNGENIIRDASVPEQFTYYHVELASHELLLAEGVPTESFIDNVDRMHFHNWAQHEELVDMTPMEEMPYPRAKSYRQVPKAIHKMIAAGAAQLPCVEAAA